jgi:senataxin
MTTLNELQTQLLSWDLVESISCFQENGSIDSPVSSKCASLPDRFLDAEEYVDAFKRPALLEFKASVLSSLVSDPVSPCEITISVIPDDARHGTDDMVELIVKFPPASGAGATVGVDYLCAISRTKSITRPCLLAISLPGGRVQGGVRLRASRRSLRSFGNLEGQFFIHVLTSMVSSGREFEAMCSVNSIRLKEEILLGIPCADSQGSLLDLTPIPPALASALDQRLNMAQRDVIDAVCGDQEHPRARVVLVRGPPGSGKTLTLNSILNALHVQQYNAYYSSVAFAVKEGRIGANERSWLDLTRIAKPRIIVCAPSNVAIDNIILRIQAEKFLDGSGRQYVPWLVRIGKGATQNQSVAQRALSRLVEKLMSKTGKEIIEKISKLENDYNEYRHGVMVQVAKLNCMLSGTPHIFRKGVETRVTTNSAGNFVAYWADHATQTTTSQIPPPVQVNEEPCLPIDLMEEWQLYTQELMRFLELWEMSHWKLQRYRLVHRYIQDSSASSLAEKFQLHHNVETLLMNQASIVCGTLNSTGLSQVRETSPFQTCVVDEAAQAVELSTLIPLRLGVKQLVLVGDPQQLPATVLSKRESVGNYERSLFERLEHCGLPVHTLTIQYRMHPIISMFPRHVFYEGILQDSESVSRITPFFAKPPFSLSPFTFVDLLSGKDIVSQQTLSRSNPDEAGVCVSIYFALLRMAQTDGFDLMGKVGVISPYSEQVRVLKHTFEAAGIKAAGNINDIEIATVDSFQGKEKDIIILSTVRACPESNSVGFLADMRRMNVALTRAKLGLFVVGKSKALAENKQWAKLIDHAKSIQAGFVQVRGAGEDMFDVFSRFYAK